MLLKLCIRVCNAITYVIDIISNDSVIVIISNDSVIVIIIIILRLSGRCNDL